LNFERISAQKERVMQERSMLHQLRTSMSFRAKKNMGEWGEIAQMS
jgi:hypothetical protein